MKSLNGLIFKEITIKKIKIYERKTENKFLLASLEKLIS